MKPIVITVASAAVALSLLGGAASANPPLKDVAYVREGLITAGMALELEDNCSSISIRMIRGIRFLQGLKNHAEHLGYTEAEIDAYIDDSAEEARLRAIASARLQALGAQTGNSASYCAVANRQITQGTQLGRLLR